ncbi:unnamed protein product, partial [Musa acuminata subsp. burmannicoides]
MKRISKHQSIGGPCQLQPAHNKEKTSSTSLFRTGICNLLNYYEVGRTQLKLGQKG